MTLVDRGGKPVGLTPIGAQIVERARRLPDVADRILQLTRLRAARGFGGRASRRPAADAAHRGPLPARPGAVRLRSQRCRAGRGIDGRTTSFETLRHLATAGLGCTPMPALAVASLKADDSLVVRPLASGERRRVGLVWRRSHSRADELRRLGTSLNETLPQGVNRLR